MGLFNVLKTANKFRKTRDALLRNYRIALERDNAEDLIKVSERYPSLNEHELAIAYLAYNSRNLDPSNPRVAKSAKWWIRVANMALNNGWVNPEVVKLLEDSLNEYLGSDFHTQG
jgi:hypothetical protein